MARTYQLTRSRRIVNWIAAAFTRLGIAGRTSYILTVPGRKSGRWHSTPITAVQDGDVRWLVAPYGPVAWVFNARAEGKVTLSRGRKSEEVSVTELPAHDAAPVLRVYLTKVGVTQPYFDVRPDSPIEAFEAEAPRHPVFLVTPAKAGKIPSNGVTDAWATTVPDTAKAHKGRAPEAKRGPREPRI